jgi:hypothetical protein
MPGGPQPDFRLTLRALPGWSTDPVIRLRHALKQLLRQHGLRCVEAVDLPRPGAQAAAGARAPGQGGPGAG